MSSSATKDVQKVSISQRCEITKDKGAKEGWRLSEAGNKKVEGISLAPSLSFTSLHLPSLMLFWDFYPPHYFVYTVSSLTPFLPPSPGISFNPEAEGRIILTADGVLHTASVTPEGCRLMEAVKD